MEHVTTVAHTMGLPIETVVSIIEWVLGATWVAGSVVAGFVYSTMLRLSLLSQAVENIESHTEERHKANERRNSELLRRIEAVDDKTTQILEILATGRASTRVSRRTLPPADDVT